MEIVGRLGEKAYLVMVVRRMAGAADIHHPLPRGGLGRIEDARVGDMGVPPVEFPFRIEYGVALITLEQGDGGEVVIGTIKLVKPPLPFRELQFKPGIDVILGMKAAEIEQELFPATAAAGIYSNLQRRIRAVFPERHQAHGDRKAFPRGDDLQREYRRVEGKVKVASERRQDHAAGIACHTDALCRAVQCRRGRIVNYGKRHAGRGNPGRKRLGLRLIRSHGNLRPLPSPGAGEDQQDGYGESGKALHLLQCWIKNYRSPKKLI